MEKRWAIISKRYKVPLSEQEQEQVIKELAAANREIERSRRKIQNLDKASKFLVVMNENAERVRDLNEKEILKNKQKAEDASQAKSSFLAQMSHEMRTPMNAIKVLSELLLRTELDKLQKDYAKNIVSASTTLLNIINDILDFSKLDANRFEIINAPYDFTSLINDVANIVNLRSLDKSIAFITDIDGTIPSMLVGDDLRLKQIFLNILQNAVKFTNDGYVKLTVKLERSPDQETVELVCMVRDTGIGIKEDNLQMLFEPFTQADLQKNRQVEGTGLGLSISKLLLELMGGSISVSSVYGEGSVFTFRFPQKIHDDTPIASVTAPEQKHVLIAGDQIKIEACAGMIHTLGISCDLAADQETALALMREKKFTHILYYYDHFHALLGDNEALIPDSKLISIKDIRYAGRQQTRPSVSVLFEPILIYEIARAIEYAENSTGFDVASDADEIGRFAVRNVSVLIVDDNEVNLMVMDQLLKQYNMDSLLAKNGMEALDLTQNQKFDIIFMDHMMPIMNGVETTKRIRDDGNPNVKTPIIIVTANAIVGMKEEFLREGLDDYISKPIDIKELNAVLKRWLPAEKIVDVVKDDRSEKSSSSFFIQGLEGLGLDSVQLCKTMGYNAETYMAIVDTFINSAPTTLQNLVKYHEAKDYDSFRIDVHGIKSALANIGANKFSQTAKTMELACKEGRFDTVKQYFPVFREELGNLIRDIQSIRPKEQQTEEFDLGNSFLVGGYNEEDIRQILGAVIDALDELDSIIALECLGNLSANLDAEQQEELAGQLKNIKICIENFDYESATEQVQQILDTYAQH